MLYLARARAVTGQMIAVDAGQNIGWRTPDIVEVSEGAPALSRLEA